jgi:hypothetical protein
MQKQIAIGAIVGGVILFVWSAISWMALPWHMMTMTPFKDDHAVAQAIVANTDRSGVYFLPSSDQNLMASGPLVYAAIRREGMTSIVPNLIKALAIDVVSAALVMWMLLQLSDRSFMGRVAFIVVLALVIGVAARLTDANWWGFPAGYTAVSIVELVIGWFLAGLAMARFAAPRISG